MSPRIKTTSTTSGDAIVARLFKRFEGVISPESMALTYRLFDKPLDDPAHRGDGYCDGSHYTYRGDAAFYPASVCKLFYAVAAYAWEKAGRIDLDHEDRRALREMIRYSSNEATCYVLGRLTDTENGRVLDDEAMQDWWQKRQVVQAFYDTWDNEAFTGLRLWHGTYEDSPYGREHAVRQHGGNRMSPLAAATMMQEIIMGRAVSASASALIRDDLCRDRERAAPNGPETLPDQVVGFVSQDVPSSIRIWSKAGLTAQTRHDVAYFQSESGASCIAAIFTSGLAAAANEDVLPAFGREIAGLLGAHDD